MHPRQDLLVLLLQKVLLVLLVLHHILHQLIRFLEQLPHEIDGLFYPCNLPNVGLQIAVQPLQGFLINPPVEDIHQSAPVLRLVLPQFLPFLHLLPQPLRRLHQRLVPQKVFILVAFLLHYILVSFDHLSLKLRLLLAHHTVRELVEIYQRNPIQLRFLYDYLMQLVYDILVSGGKLRVFLCVMLHLALKHLVILLSYYQKIKRP